VTTLAELTTQVRQAVRDQPRTKIDNGSGDGASTVFSLGKELGVITNSDVVSVAAVLQARNVDYTIDYDACQIAFTTPPAAGAAIRAQYREAIWRDELIYQAINDGRRMLFPKFYQPGSATITVRNNVRTYKLDGVDVNEPTMRTIFAQGPATFKILNGRVQPLGSVVDQLWVPFRKFYQEWSAGSPYVQVWRMLGLGDILRLNVMYGFTPLVLAADVTDIPDRLQPLVVLWACSALALKMEPQRARLDTANTQQSMSANPPGTMAQTAEDFQKKFWDMYKSINSEPPVFEVRDIPLPWEAGYRGYV